MTAPLPPLPPTFGGADVFPMPAGRSVIDLLVDEHYQITTLCGEFTDPAVPAGRRREICDVVTAAISRHLSAEEQYLYPMVRVVLPDGEHLADQEIAEDRAMLRVLRELAATATDDARFARLAETVSVRLRRHVHAASMDLFPRLRDAASEVDLVRLGNRFVIAEEAAPTRPHPGIPANPPWNKVIDPAVGVVDKVRDAMSGRTTYAEDL